MMLSHSAMTSNGMLCPAMEASYSQSSEDSIQSPPFNNTYPDLYSSSPVAQDLDMPFTQSPIDPFYDMDYDFSPPNQYAFPEMHPVPNTSYAISAPCPAPQYYDPCSASLSTSIPSSSSSSLSPPLQWSFGDESPIPRFSLGMGVGDSPPGTSPKSTKPFPCTDCGKAFGRSADLKRHQTSVHYPVFQDCPVQECSRKDRNGFPRRDHMIEHLRSYHHLPIPKQRASKRVAKAHIREELAS